jgi:hypothetical protein
MTGQVSRFWWWRTFIGYIYREITNSAVKVTAEAIKVGRDSAVASLINHLREGYAIDSCDFGKLCHRHPTTIAKLLLSKKFL